ncbi:hypothetical protein [Maritalea porphyrae]|uniref:hypothetical protein n=1 Tax=Maritalea porphyrae TaxID=880732 RepID=UPI0022AF5C4A|nr:hypothetical protein [Maritalea porphyrae]MCZ4271452.1 hypothetical protein [Maritalea porphyrae]
MAFWLSQTNLLEDGDGSQDVCGLEPLTSIVLPDTEGSHKPSMGLFPFALKRV